MKTYWDYSEKERSQMSEEDVRSLLDVELMSKGVLKVVEPTLREIKTFNISQITYYEVNGVFFETADQAQKFLELNPLTSEYDYYGAGYDYKYAAPGSREIKQVMLYDRQEVLNLKIVLTENKIAKEENEKIVRMYNKATEEQNEVFKGVWDDWFDQKNRAFEHQKIQDTRAKYLELAKGDAGIAEIFLKKVFSEDAIAASDKWFNK
jgi:hypothetical protein